MAAAFALATARTAGSVIYSDMRDYGEPDVVVVVVVIIVVIVVDIVRWVVDDSALRSGRQSHTPSHWRMRNTCLLQRIRVICNCDCLGRETRFRRDGDGAVLFERDSDVNICHGHRRHSDCTTVSQ